MTPILLLNLLMMATYRSVDAQPGIDVCNGHVTTVNDLQDYEVVVPPRMEDPNCRGHQLLKHKVSRQLFCMAKIVTDPSKCTNLKCTDMPTTTTTTTSTTTSPTTTITTTVTTTKTTTQTTTLPPQYSCGRDNGLVSSEKYVDWERFPWLVYLQRREEDDPTQNNIPDREDYEYRTMCIGTIVNQRWVLVAAHCVYEDDSESTYRIVYDKGANTGALSKAPHEVNDGIHVPNDQHPYPRKINDGKKMRVRRVIRHPQYTKNENKPKSKFDMALLELTSAVEYTNFTGPVCMPEFNGEDNQAGTGVEVMGCCGHDSIIKTNNVRIRGSNDGWWNPEVPTAEKMDSSWISNTNLRYQRGVIKAKNVCDTRQSDPGDTFGTCVIPIGDPNSYKMKCFSVGGGPGAMKKGQQWFQVLLASYTFGNNFRPCTCVCYVEDYAFDTQEGLNHAYYQPLDNEATKRFLEQNDVTWSTGD